MEMSK